MRRTPATLCTTLALALAGLGATAVPALAKPCGSIEVRGKDYTVGGGGASCHFMRKWSRRMAKKGRTPNGWKCDVRANGGSCKRGHGDNRDFFIYYPVD